VITNHPTGPVKTGGTEANTFVLLMDGANLAFPDFANAREQSLRFLKTLPDNQPVALYAMKKFGFQVLVDATSNHDAIAARLAKWMPTAADMSEAQYNEERNRQSFDTVLKLEDLLSVNGNQAMDTGSQQEALDAKLRPLGSDPPKSALEILVDVGRHLGAFPGHKSLVWVTSDNALVDWNNASTTVEKTSKNVEPAALRVQEAMNNAHVSVYPLDASGLEGNAVDASKYGRNVELSPTFMTLPNGAAPGGLGPEATAGATPLDPNQAQNLHRDMTTNRLYAQMQQDMRPIQGVFREIAAATGGQALRRSNNMVGQLSGVAAEGRATYLLGFSPSQAADGQYHLLTVKLVGRKDATLRYRSGYQYDKDPSTVKARFAKVVWEPMDAGDIALRATPPTTDRSTLKLNIAATDLAMAQTGDLWTDKIGVFLVRRDDAQKKAQITGQTMNLRLKPETYQKLMREGIPFEQIVEQSKITGSVRIVVIDENSGRMGSITLPAGTLLARNATDEAKQ
jgi:VWFA-related protein